MKQLLLILIVCMVVNHSMAMERPCGAAFNPNDLPDELLEIPGPTEGMPVNPGTYSNEPLNIPEPEVEALAEPSPDLAIDAAPASKRMRTQSPVPLIDLEPDEAGPSGAGAGAYKPSGFPAPVAIEEAKPWPKNKLREIGGQAWREYHDDYYGAKRKATFIFNELRKHQPGNEDLNFTSKMTINEYHALLATEYAAINGHSFSSLGTHQHVLSILGLRVNIFSITNVGRAIRPWFHLD